MGSSAPGRPQAQGSDPQPKDVADCNDTPAKSRLMYRMIHLALQTDSTRTVAIMAQDQHATHKIPGSDSHRSLTHHGNRTETIAQLRRMEENQLRAFREFLGLLHDAREDGETLLDRTMVLQGAGMGNANANARTPDNTTSLTSCGRTCSSASAKNAQHCNRP